MKLSMVIPAYTINDELKELLIRCILSYRDKVDEMIVTEDGGNYVQEVRDLVDVYLLNKENVSFTKNVNRGLKIATGDFIAIVNSDTTLHRGNIRDLCIPGTVTSPEIANQFWGGGLAGPFFVIPREVLIERGPLNEAFITYSSDSEYHHRVKDILKIVRTVRIFHEMGKTTAASGKDTPESRAIEEAHFAEFAKENKIDLEAES